MQKLNRCYNSVRRQAFARSRRWISGQPDLLKVGVRAVPVIVLLAPSIWMLCVIPPLWRDIDAYGEVTQPPGTGTILLYGPLYCFAARIPLYLGYVLDWLRAGGPLPTLHFFVQPSLTDSGVFALVISQHVGLCCASYYLIASTSRVLWVRLVLAIASAINPLFYTFAHTVGSEALSMILVLLLAATGLKIVLSSRRTSRKEWVVLGIFLWLCILTRHINALLAALMPAAFIVLGVYHFIVVSFTRPEAMSRSLWSKAKEPLQKAALAVAVGISCIVLANASVRVLCYATRIPYYSTLGLSFLYRLKFLAGLPPEKRNELLDEASKHADSADVKRVISLLRESFPTETSKWDVKAFNLKATALLFTPQTDPDGEKYAVLLNCTALAFLYPPNETFLSAVATDFKRSQEITIPDVVAFLFVSTRFYFSHREAMPQCASLVTFRGKNADQVFAIFKKHSFFRHPKNGSYRVFLVSWLVVLSLFLLIAKTRERESADLACYAVALTIGGLFMMLANCLLVVFQPRYTLPMWELTIISLSVLSAKIMESVSHDRQQRQEFAHR